MSAIAIAIGAASVVLIIGVSQSGAGQIALRLSAYDTNTLTATISSQPWLQSEEDLVGMTSQISAVEAAGTFNTPSGSDDVVKLSSGTGLSAEATVIVASAYGLKARDAIIMSGGMPTWDVAERDPFSLVVGSALASQLGLGTDSGTNRLSINGKSMTVVGVARDGGLNSLVSSSIIVSPETSRLIGVEPGPRTLLVRAHAGSANAVGPMLLALLNATNPDSASVSVPPTPAVLSGQLSSDTQALVLLVTLIVLATTAFGIATTMQIAVWERRLEIGVRGALGETRVSIGRTFLLEAVLIGTAGSVAGWSLGVVGTALVTTLLGWPFLLPAEAFLAILIGPLVGGISGVVPAIQASRVDPIIMIRT